MITRNSRVAKRTMATAAAVAMIGSTLAISGSAFAGPGAAAPTTARLSGTERAGTAVDVAGTLADLSTITIATGRNFPDGLASASLNDAILLTEVDSIPAATLAFLEANNAAIDNIQIIGGEAAVSAAVATQLAAYGTVVRLQGPTRYSTATDVAEAAFPDATTMILATGENFPDALASGPLSIEAGAPIVLNSGDALRDEVLAYLTINPQITDVYIVGGTSAVPATVEAELVTLGKTVKRLDGTGRDGTAVAIANELNVLGDYNDSVVIANGRDFPDAMVAGPFAAANKSPILLVAPDSTPKTAARIPDETAKYLKDNASTIGEIVAIGGTAVISDASLAGAATGATDATLTNQTFAVTPVTAAIFTGDADTTVVANQNANAVTYTVDTGDATNVAIVLANPANVTDTNGVVTFKRLGAVADLGTGGDIFINQINGNNIGRTPTASSVTPVNGQVTFRVNGNENEFGSAIPVVYVPTAGNMPVSADGMPTSGFGIGGQATALPTERTRTNAMTVSFVNTAESYFVGNDGADDFLLRFSTADTKTMGALTLSNAQFAASLSVGDVIQTTYDVVASDTFDYTTDITSAATIGTAALVDTDGNGTNDSVRVSWTNPTNIAIVDYTVQTTTVAADGTVNAAGWADDGGFTVNTPPVGFATAGATVTADNPTLVAGSYAYRVKVRGFGPAAASVASAATNSITNAAAPAAITGIAPRAFVLTTDTTDPGQLGAGDVITATFASGVAVSGSASITVVNELGETAVITQGAATATFTVSGNSLTVTLAGPPSQTTGTAPFGTLGNIQLNDTSGVTGSASATTLPNVRRTASDADRTALVASTVVPAAPTVVSASASANTVTATVLANSFVRVYDNTGRTLLGTSPVIAAGGPVTFGTSDLVPSQNILVVQSTTGATALLESTPTGSVVGMNEIQAIAQSAAADAGTVDLTLNGATVTINFNDSAAAIKTAVESFAGVTTVTVTNQFDDAADVIIEFVDPAKTNINQITVVSALFDGPSPIFPTPSTTQAGTPDSASGVSVGA